MLNLISSSIVFNGKKVSSHEIMRRLMSISYHIAKCLTPVSIVGVALNRSPDLIISLLAIYELGATFVILDTNMPTERLNDIIANANIDMILTCHSISIDSNEVVKSYIYLDDICTDYALSEITQIDTTKNKIMYILFTSGTTGKAKGVKISREAFENFMNAISEVIDFAPKKRIACLTTASFDIFLLESVMALNKDLDIVLANEDEQHNPKLLAKLIQANDVEMIQMTPSRMQLLYNYDNELSCLKNIKEIMIGGEQFPINLLYALQGKTTAKIYNMYGPTETTIWSTVSDLTIKDRIDIGQPIKNTKIFIIDENGDVLPNGKIGEICIAGRGLAEGYVERDYLSAEKFTYLMQRPKMRIYRTGDLGRYLPDGNLEYLGRIDNQVKIKGYRIELEEVEAYVNQFDGIKQSIAAILETNEKDKILEVYYTASLYIDPKEISSYLISKLPRYMIPVIYKQVEEFIHTPNGKIDRKQLGKCILINSAGVKISSLISEDLSDIQKRVLNCIVSIFDKEVLVAISIDITFTEVGIDSISFIRIIVALEEEFDFVFEDEMLHTSKFPTIRAMINYVETKITNNNHRL